MFEVELSLNTLLVSIEHIFAGGVAALEHILFFSLYDLPLIIGWLLVGAVFLTFRMGFINIRGFIHGCLITLGRYDDSDMPGEATHFQALATALSATVGLGNIAGVAIALQMGGPGAILWMTLVGFLGMTSKFVECTLAQQYRIIQPDGHILGGPMYYLSLGLSELGLKPLGRLLAVSFAGFCLFSSLGGGNLFQANQSSLLISTLGQSFWGGAVSDYRWIYGVALALTVGLVIIGGFQRIARVSSVIVPLMAGLYLLAALWIVSLHLDAVPTAIQTVWQSAWHPQAVEGGIIGVLVQGLRRGVGSNEAGLGPAAIAHAMARTQEPIREGLVAMLEPFIDTVVICNLTALVCLVTGVYQDTELDGITLTLAAFTQEIPLMSWGLGFIAILFSFSTIVSWFYYGETSWRYLFGDRGLWSYKLLYTSCVFIGTVISLQAILTFGDMMKFCMGVPSMTGAILLSNQVAQKLADYNKRLPSFNSLPRVTEAAPD